MDDDLDRYERLTSRLKQLDNVAAEKYSGYVQQQSVRSNYVIEEKPFACLGDAVSRLLAKGVLDYPDSKSKLPSVFQSCKEEKTFHYQDDAAVDDESSVRYNKDAEWPALTLNIQHRLRGDLSGSWSAIRVGHLGRQLRDCEFEASQIQKALINICSRTSSMLAMLPPGSRGDSTNKSASDYEIISEPAAEVNLNNAETNNVLMKHQMQGQQARLIAQMQDARQLSMRQRPYRGSDIKQAQLEELLQRHRSGQFTHGVSAQIMQQNPHLMHQQQPHPLQQNSHLQAAAQHYMQTSATTQPQILRHTSQPFQHSVQQQQNPQQLLPSLQQTNSHFQSKHQQSQLMQHQVAANHPQPLQQSHQLSQQLIQQQRLQQIQQRLLQQQQQQNHHQQQQQQQQNHHHQQQQQQNNHHQQQQQQNNHHQQQQQQNHHQQQQQQNHHHQQQQQQNHHHQQLCSARHQEVPLNVGNQHHHFHQQQQQYLQKNPRALQRQP